MEDNLTENGVIKWNDNRSYFLFPLKIDNYKMFEKVLKTGWQPLSDPFEIQYLLKYAAKIGQTSSPERMLAYRCTSLPPVYMFESKISDKMARYKESHPSFEPSGLSPSLSDIRLYVFQKNIAFLEFEVLYGGMTPEEAAEFIYLFRSLRNDETKKYLLYPEDKISVKTAINMLLPPKESGTALCFENTSDIKMQANIFTIICDPAFAPGSMDDNGFRHLCYTLYKGYSCARPDDENDSGYQFSEKLGKTQWGGCQDGLTCMIYDPYPHQDEHLRNDYHLIYLLLLNQRYMAIACIDKISQANMKNKDIHAVYREISDLKTRYSFRVVSNDSYMQTLYNRMYEILEIDNLLKDTEDANDRMNDVYQVQRQQAETIFNFILFGLAFLAVFSALIDFSQYLDRWKSPDLNTIISLITTVLIIVLVLILWRVIQKFKK